MPRPKLIGTYRTPEFDVGQRVIDQRRGEVRIIGLSPGRIRWPIGQLLGGRSLVLYGDLAEAVRRESGVAICYWFKRAHRPTPAIPTPPPWSSKADYIVRLFAPTVAAAKLGVPVEIVAARREELGL